MKNQNGFTLIEILVAMTIMVIAVFCFTPLMLSSLRSVELAWEQRDEMYREKADVEESLAKGVDPYHEMENKIVRFSQGGSYSDKDGTVAGYIIESGDTKIFVAQDTAKMSVSPRRISENAANNSTEFELYSELIEFKTVNEFSLTGLGDNTKYAGVSFSIDPDDAHRATMKITNTDALSMNKSPYTVSYGGSEYLSAKLRVTPPSIAAVGAGGAYYIKKNGKWVSPYTKGTSTLRDAAWTSEYLVLSGDAGSWHYAGDEGWGSVAGSALENYAGLHYSSATGMLYSFLNKNNSAYKIETNNPSNIESQLLYSLHTGTAIQSTGDSVLWATKSYLNTYINGTTWIASQKEITDLAWNGLPGNDSEVVASFADKNFDTTGCGIGSKKGEGAWTIQIPLNNYYEWSIYGYIYHRYGFNSVAFGNGTPVVVGYHRVYNMTNLILGSNGIICYRDTDGKWKNADIGAGYGELNCVRYIGGKFYAVGNNGTILVSTNGKNWSPDAKASGLTANLYAIAGWGEQ